MNKVTLFGRLGKDPELNETEGGLKIARTNIATSVNVKDGDDWKEKTTWHRVVTFGNRAGAFAQYLQKGSPVLIEGRIDNYSYEKDGETKYVSEVVVENFHFVGWSKKDDEAQASEGAGLKNHAPQTAAEAPKTDYSEEVPF
jgi:single-strand DNA-binding protein